VPSLDAAADTTLALSTIDESLDTGQREPRRMARAATEVRIYTQGRFSRRLQLDPGLTPPTSWSLSPCTGPRIHWRAKLVDCPGLGAIYLNLARSPVNLCVMAVIATSSVLRAFMSRRYESLTPVSAGSDQQGSSARHPRPRHPTSRAALHGRARQRPDPGGGGLPRIHGLPAGGRDPADPERGRGDQP
jgi:hypothetical protein